MCPYNATFDPDAVIFGGDWRCSTVDTPCKINVVQIHLEFWMNRSISMYNLELSNFENNGNQQPKFCMLFTSIKPFINGK